MSPLSASSPPSKLQLQLQAVQGKPGQRRVELYGWWQMEAWDPGEVDPVTGASLLRVRRRAMHTDWRRRAGWLVGWSVVWCVHTLVRHC